MIKSILLAATAAIAIQCATVHAAFAQAADAGADEGGLDEIIVTAQKRAENIQDIPAAVSAISGDELQNRGIAQTSDLAGALPNLQVTSAYSSTQPNFSLRGISVANEFSASTASPVGVYVDEVYQSFRASHGQQLYDLERVEVLRGPQGTLYGRNTTGGAINFITRKPRLGDAQGYFTAGYGNFDTYSLQGAAEVTLVPDEFGIRIAGTRAKGDGYTFNPTLNKDFATTDSLAGRITARWKPSDKLDITLKLFGAKADPRQDIPYGIGYLQGRTDAAGYSRFAPRPELGGRTLKRNEIQADTAGTYFVRTTGASLSIQYELADNVTLNSSTGYDHLKYHLSPFDCDGSPTNICAIRYLSIGDNFNQDLHLNYEGNGLKLIGGVYYGRDKIRTRNEEDFFGFLRPLLLGAGLPSSFNNAPIAVLGGDALKTLPAFAVDPTLTPASPGFCAPVVVNANGFFDARSLIAFQADIAATNAAGQGAAQAACAAAGAPPFGPILATQRFTIDRPSAALYGEAAWEATDKLTLTLGLRYTRDTVKYKNASTVLFDLGGKNPAASLVPYSFPFNPSFKPVNQRERTGRLTGRFVADYKFAKDILGYASFSRGFRAGTYNGLAYQDIRQVYFVKPEKVDAYEVGLKTRLFDRRVQLNLAGFYYDYGNQQIAQIVGATSFLRNASGRLYGGEAELAIQAADNLRFDAALGLLNSRYKGNKIDLTDPRSLTLNINGNPFPNAPETTFQAGFDWTPLEIGNGKLQLRGETQYQGRYYFDPFKDYGQKPCDQPVAGTKVLQATPELACGNPGYWLFNGRITYATDRYSISVWGKNLTNKFYYSYGLNLNAFFEDYLVRGAPRTYGVEATVRF